MRTLVVDDDDLSARMVAARLAREFPAMVVDTTCDPGALGAYDVYLIDNEFDGEARGTSLARTIRREHPEALVVALSGTLDAPTLKALVNAGCHGACDKGDDQDFATLLDLIRSFLTRVAVGRAPGRGFLGVLRSMTELLRQWNERLDQLEPR